MEQLVTLNIGFDKTRKNINKVSGKLEFDKYFFIEDEGKYLAIVWSDDKHWTTAMLKNIDNIVVINTIKIDKQYFLNLFKQIIIGVMLKVSDCEILTKWESKFNSQKSEVPEEYETIISNIESINNTIQNIRELKIRCGNEYCCVNTKMGIAITTDSKNNRYTIFVRTTVEDSELFNYWKRNLNTPKFKGYKILKVSEYADIYLNKLISDHICECKNLYFSFLDH